MPNQTITLAICQKPPVFFNRDATCALALDTLDEASAAGVDLLATPETWLSGYPVWIDHAPRAGLWGEPGAKALYRLLCESAISKGDATITALQNKVDATGVSLVLGANELDGGTLYNVQVSLVPGGTPFFHRKLVPTYTERLIWGMGDGSTIGVVDAPFGKLGALICWEHWMPLTRAAMHDLGEVVHVANWPGASEMHHVATRHYAFEGGCFAIAAGTVIRKQDLLDGLDSLQADEPDARAMLEAQETDVDGYLRRGGSAVFAPDGGVIRDPVYDKIELITAEVDLSCLTETKMALDTSGHYSRPDVFNLTVNTTKQRNVDFVE